MNREEIEREIEAFRQKHESSGAFGDWRGVFYNNLGMKLPGRMCQRHSFDGALSKKPSEEGFRGASLVFLGRTLGEFFDAVADAARARGFDEERFAELIDYSRAGYADAREKIFAIIQPIYIDLRLKGYRHYPDLTR